MNGLVSVVMCTYNGERYLDAQIQSIVDQDYPSKEIIIVDDCSTDNTYQKLELWQSKYPSIIHIYQNEKNLGYNQNFARAITLAKGEYIAISDQDDIWLPQKLSKQVHLLEQHPNASLIHHKEQKIIDDELQTEYYPLIQWNIDYQGSDLRRFVLINVIAGHLMLFRASLIASLIPFPGEDYVYDYWIATVAALKGRILYIDEVLLYHRLHDNNTWFNKDRTGKIGNELGFFEAFAHKRYTHLMRLPLDSKARYFVEKLQSCLENTKSRLPLLLLLLRFRKKIFPVKSKYKILEEYAYLKRCFSFYKMK